ncbi:MAG TPA: phenylalanine--tRNA ligase subunit alpha [Armatimonadota bacterium]
MNIDELLKDARARIGAANTSVDLDALDTEYLGRKGSVTALRRTLGQAAAEDRPRLGQAINAAAVEVEALVASRRAELLAGETAARLEAERLDVTLPGAPRRLGRVHPLTATINRVQDIFCGLGFTFLDMPDVEDVAYNFGALNYPEDHPAMDEQMSFFVEGTAGRYMLRTQTTAFQGHILEKVKPPFRFATVGRCYRYEAVDATHGHTFHQVDCFAVGEGISMADLRGTLQEFVNQMFGEGVTVRFRPDFFPFVEPGAEIAIRWEVDGQERYLELGGAGLVHPNILEHFGIDSERYTGFAFGLGLERMPMIQYGIPDLRLFWENDLRFLEQF